MCRIVVGLSPSILILVTCSWLVQVAGQSYRRRFQETARDRLANRLVQGEQPQAPAAPPRSPTQNHDGSVAGAWPCDSGPSRGSAHQEGPRASISGPHCPPVPPPIETPAPKPPAPTPATRHNWPVDPIQWKDPLKLTHDEEVQVGKAVHEVILQHHQVREDPEFQNRLYKLLHSAPAVVGLSLEVSSSRLEGSHRVFPSGRLHLP